MILSFARLLAAETSAVSDQELNLIRPEAIRAHMRFLSDDLLEGRGTGTRGYQIAAKYIATELEALGLKPAGVAGSWFQQVPLRKIDPVAERSSIAVVANGKEQVLKDGEDYAMSGSAVYTDVSVEAPVVFAGFGVTAPEVGYDDYAGLDARGKIVVVLLGAPARLSSTERAYYAHSVTKGKNAVAHGAVGMITILTPEEQKRYAWNWIVPQVRAGSMRWLDEQGKPKDVFPEIRGGALFSQGAAERLFAGAPKTLAQVFAATAASQPTSFALPVTLKIHTVSRHSVVEAPNVVGVLPGSDSGLRDQYVVYSAHLDHLGHCPAVKGDDICHGALDNASGTASLLEIAHAFASMPQAPRRSLLFVFVTGEEKGLLGSDYFASHPTVPLSQIVANVNIDEAPGFLYPLKDVVALGAEHSSLNRDVQEAAKRLGYEISPDPMPEEVFFIRSDQFSFVRQGVPAVDITDGLKSSDPQKNGAEITKQWMTTIYHTPKDSMAQPLDYESAARAVRLNFVIGYEVAQRQERPAWNPGDFFGVKFAPKTATTAAAQ
jgi:Zn-dependent M28 family amino/carboxypeptidase